MKLTAEDVRLQPGRRHGSRTVSAFATDYASFDKIEQSIPIPYASR